ncbi:MAG TPA: hypothetical protein VGI40_20390 [Pirellulaceae bacterium]
MFRFRLRTLLIMGAALPIWAYLIAVVANSPGFGALGLVVAPVVLVGIAAAVYRLTMTLADGFAIAVLLSPILTLALLLIVAAITRINDQ